jgi:CheY-like chemotaxis protein
MVLAAIPQKIVIVEDNISLADIYKTRLEMIGYRCFTAYDGEQALSVIQLEQPSLVLLDLMVPKIAGDQILARMRASDWGKNIKVYIISNLNESDAPVGLREYGIEGYTVKANLSDDALDKLVDSILKPNDQTESVSLESSDMQDSIADQNLKPTLPPYNPITYQTDMQSAVSSDNDDKPVSGTIDTTSVDKAPEFADAPKGPPTVTDSTELPAHLKNFLDNPS